MLELKNIRYSLFLFFYLLYSFEIFPTPNKQQTIDSLNYELNSIKNENDTLKGTLYSLIAYEFLGKNNDSLKHYADLGLEFSEKYNFQNGIADALRMQAVYNFYNQKTDKALQQLKEAQNIYLKNKNHTGLATVYYNTGLIYRALGDLNNSLDYFEKSYLISIEYNLKKQLGNALIAKANILAKKGDTDEAIVMLEESFEILTSLNETKLIGTIYSNIGVIYNKTGDIEKSLEYNQKALDIFKEVEDNELIISSIINIANCALRLGKDLYAIETLQNAIPIAKENNYFRHLGMLYITLANTYLEISENNKAREYFEKGREISKDKDIINYAAASVNIAIIDQSEKKFEKALENFNLALEIYKEYNHENEVCLTLNAIAYNYLKTNDLNNALSFFNKSLELNTNNKYKLVAGNTYLGISSIYLKQQKIKLAEENALKAYKILQEVQSKDDLKKATHRLYEIYKLKNNTNLALQYHEEYKSISDSLFNNEKSKERGRLEAEFEYKMMAEKLALENENKLLEKEFEISKQKYYSTLLGVFVLVFIIISAILFYLKKTRDKTNLILLKNKKVIEQSNAELEELHLQKNKLFSIIAHDLRGPLNSVGMLLDMALSNKISDEELKTFLPEINKEITNTKILTENLLNWAGKSMEEYSKNKKLLNLYEAVEDKKNLFFTNLKNKKIELINNVDKNCQLYIDQNALELVLRNLISNAIKFCRENDSITISCSKDDNFTKVCITDTGIGMKEKTANKLFFDKTVESTSGTSEEKGSGIGLMLCKNFIAENGGKIWVESSKIGKGTKVCFTVPNKI